MTDQEAAQELLGRLAMDPNVKATIIFEPTMSFSMGELKTLYALIEREYISHENEAAHAVINKIFEVIRAHELASGTRKST
ncbi:MAG: hypothetical protein ABWY25_11485 [Paenisporosarcina sp.]